jgi:pimeloyl-ACP methyl ester carboxylesterase
VTYIIAIPLLLFAYLYFFQDHMLYYPRPVDKSNLRIIDQYFPGSDIALVAADGKKLTGWHWQPGTAVQNQTPVLVYFGGNAEDVSGMFIELAGLRQYAVATLNYRGYGTSEGRPSEKSMFKDALVLYDDLVNNRQYSADQIILIGRSLGTGVAVYLASQRKVRSLVLISPYDSMTSLASHHYPYAPVKWLLKHRYDSISLAAGINEPLLAITGSSDRIVPPDHARRLTEAWAGQANLVEIARADHNDVTFYPEYLQSLKAFLRQSVSPENSSDLQQ